MATFQTRTIEEVTERLIDYRGKTPPKAESGVRLITAKVIKDGFIQEERAEYISEETYTSWMGRGYPQQNDIVLTTEAPLGEVAQLRKAEQIALAQRVILLRGNPNIISQQFFFQAIKSPFVQAGLQQRATGTTVLGIKQSELRKVNIPYYPLSTQRKIAAILSAYDDLIENNLRRIKILEEMAQNLYRKWFGKAHFQGHPQTRLTDSPIDRITEGWEMASLGQLADQIRDSVNPDSVDPETPYIGLEHLPRKSISLSDWGTASEVQSTKLLFRKGDILFGKIRPYFHKVGVAPLQGICSSDIIVIRPRAANCFGIVLGCTSSIEFVEHATATSQGTKMPRANWDVLVKYQIPMPPQPILSKFNEFMSEIVNSLNLLRIG